MGKNNKKAQDMSVRDILNSIKGIIDGHQDTPKMEASDNSEDVLELTDIIEEDRITEEDSRIKSGSNIAEEVNEGFLSATSAEEASRLFKQFADDASTALREDKRSRSISVEELVIEMVRPQLKSWLNENLPLLVQQIIEKEIKRLIPDGKKEE